MNIWLKTIISFGFMLSCNAQVNGEPIVFRSPTGDLSIIDVREEDSFKNVVDLIKTEICTQELYANCSLEDTSYDHKECILDFMAAKRNEMDPVYSKGSMRNYNSPLTSEERKKIYYIVDTLGNSSLIAIAKAKFTIEISGKEVEHVHPLQFLLCIFSDEKLKAAVHNMQNRSWVWGRFSKGIKGGLEDEANRNNLLPYLENFSKVLRINSKIFLPLAEKHQWKEFIDALLKHVPRPDTSRRYDM